MDRTEFDSLSIVEQLNFINEELQNGKTLRKVCTEIGVGRTTVRDRAVKVGYVYDKELNKYVLADISRTTDDKCTTKPGVSKCDDACHTDVVEPKKVSVTNENVHDDKRDTLVISDDLKSNLVNLAENYEVIVQMIDKFKSDDECHTNVVERGIKIELPKEKVADFRTTIRVNDLVWKGFKKFCDVHSEFTQKDLLSQALQEFMNKHKE